MPARAIDSATLTFGLVAIPVKIYATSERSHEVHFHLVHKGCGERLRQQYVCPRHGAVERDEMAKGFELTRGNFVELSQDELDALEAVASDEIAIQEFVPADAVDPVSIAHSYYLGPGKGGERAYRLFRDALGAAGLVGIAAYAARGKQYIVELLPYQTGLAMLQLRYPDEIKAWSEVGAAAHGKPTPAELGLARRVIDHLRHATFDPSRYKDEVKQRVRALIASKAKGGEIVAPPSVERPPVTDLMAALKASLGAGAASNGKRAAAGADKDAGETGRGRGGGAGSKANGTGKHDGARPHAVDRTPHGAHRRVSALFRSCAPVPEHASAPLARRTPRGRAPLSRCGVGVDPARSQLPRSACCSAKPQGCRTQASPRRRRPARTSCQWRRRIGCRPASPGMPASGIDGSRGKPASNPTPASTGPVVGAGEPEPDPEPGPGALGDDGDGEPGCGGDGGGAPVVGGVPGGGGDGGGAPVVGGVPGCGGEAGGGAPTGGAPGAGAAGAGAPPDGAEGVIGCAASSIAASGPPLRAPWAPDSDGAGRLAWGAPGTPSTPASAGASIAGAAPVIGFPLGSVGSGRGAEGASL